MTHAMRRARVFLYAVLGVVLLAAPAAGVRDIRIVYNPSSSVPPGWYGVVAVDSLELGDIVLAWLPDLDRALAGERGYLPSHLPILKRIGAMASQHVCIRNGTVHVDGMPVATVQDVDAAGRPLQSWTACRALESGELFLLSVTHPASFDSRYFGPISVGAVLGRAQPIWVWEAP